MSLSFSPSPSSHHAETEEQAAGPSCCDSLAGVTASAGKQRSAGRVDAVPFLCYSLVGALHRFWLTAGVWPTYYHGQWGISYVYQVVPQAV